MLKAGTQQYELVTATQEAQSRVWHYDFLAEAFGRCSITSVYFGS